MTKDDLARYIEEEAPGIGILINDVAAVVCEHEECDERVTVDPATLVEEDEGAESVAADVYDPETGETTGRTELSIYCSEECKRKMYYRETTTDG